MADLTDTQAAQSVKIVGTDATGLETNPVGADASGNLKSVVNNGSGASAVNIQDGGNSISVDDNGGSLTIDGTVTSTPSFSNKQIDAFGRLRVSDTDLVESLHFSNAAHTGLLINTSTAGAATIAYNGATSSLRFTNTTASGDSAIIQTRRYFRYNPGRSYLITISGNMGAKKANVQQRIGYFDALNGLFFEQTSTDLKVVVRTDASGSAVDTAVTQANWNIDKLDGTGASGVTLDTSKHNLYVIDYLWHGAGRIRFGIFYNGEILYCHQINEANVNTAPFMRIPALPLRAELVNTGTAASGTTMDVVCFAYQKESSDDLQSPYSFTASMSTTAKSINSTTPLPLISIRPKTTFNGNVNRVPIQVDQFEVFATQDSVYVRILLNPTLTGASFASVGTNSAVEVDTAATAVSGGTIIHETYVPGGGKGLSSIVELLDEAMLGLNIAGSTADILTIAAAKLNGNSDTYGIIGWEEYQ